MQVEIASRNSGIFQTGATTIAAAFAQPVQQAFAVVQDLAKQWSVFASQAEAIVANIQRSVANTSSQPVVDSLDSAASYNMRCCHDSIPGVRGEKSCSACLSLLCVFHDNVNHRSHVLLDDVVSPECNLSDAVFSETYFALTKKSHPKASQVEGNQTVAFHFPEKRIDCEISHPQTAVEFFEDKIASG